MECPYCKNELIKGEVQCQQGGMIYWQPEASAKEVNKMRFSEHGVKSHGGIVLSKHQMNVISEPLIGYCCTACKKVIVDFAE